MDSVFNVFYFYLILLIFTIIGFPISYFIFTNFKDKGYAFSKLISVLFIAFTTFLISSVTNIPYTFFTLLFSLILLSLLSGFIFLKKREIVIFLKKNKKIIIFEEILFLSFYIFFIFVRFGNPDLWHPVMGGEKPMDFAFINALVRSDSLPPYDPWFAGESINYYYFGQFITASLVKLTNIPSSIFYNIMLSYLFAQTALGIYGIIFSLTKSKKWSLLGPALLIGIGNLGQIKVVIDNFIKPIPINGWYWTATRIMPNFEINEFPYFTFLYADLHSHLIALPIALFLISIGLEIFKEINLKKIILLSILSGIVLGILRISNTWDFPTFALFLLMILAYKFISNLRKSIFIKFVKFFLLSTLFVLSSFVFIYPFLANFKTGPAGLDFYKGPYTNIYDYLIIHGLFIFIIIFFSIVSILRLSIKKVGKLKRLLLLIPLAIFLFAFTIKLYFIAFLSIIILFSVFSYFSEDDDNTKLALLIFMFAMFLTSIPDILDIKLGLGRMNTVFKFYFQAWVFFAIAGAFLVFQSVKMLKNQKLLRISYLTVLITIFVCSFIYIPTSTYAKIEDRMSQENNFTLNGEDYMKNSIYYDENGPIKLSYDYDTIQFLKDKIHENAVILEASTPIYRWGSRISIYTGLPTVLGWDWHEIAHRQYLDPINIHQRQSDIQMIYESTDLNLTKNLLEKYKVKYIILGQLEKYYYNAHGLQTIIRLNGEYFEKIYENSESAVYLYKN